MHEIDDVFHQLKAKFAATTRPPSGDTVFSLRLNNCFFRESCGACGESHKDAMTPAWIFSAHGALCYRCAIEKAPALYRYADDLQVLEYLRDDGDPAPGGLPPAIGSLLECQSRESNLAECAELVRLLDEESMQARIAELQRLAEARRAQQWPMTNGQHGPWDDAIPF